MNQDLVKYLPLVQAAAWRLHHVHNLPLHLHPDLVQEGFIGLLDAQTRYDPNRQTTFGTFARPRVLGAMLDHFAQESRVDCQNFMKISVAPCISSKKGYV